MKMDRFKDVFQINLSEFAKKKIKSRFNCKTPAWSFETFETVTYCNISADLKYNPLTEVKFHGVVIPVFFHLFPHNTYTKNATFLPHRKYINNK